MSDATTQEPSTEELSTEGPSRSEGPTVRAEGRAHAVLLALSAAAFAFASLVSKYLPEGISEKEESRIYIYASVLVPAFGLLYSFAMDRVKRRFFETHQLFYPLLGLAHAAFWARWVHRLRDAYPVPLPKGAVIDVSPLFHTLINEWLIGNVALLVIAVATRSRWLGGSARPRLVRGIDRLVPLIVAYALLPFASPLPVPKHYLYLLGLAGIASLLHGELARFPRETKARYAFDALVIVAMILLVLDPAMDVDVYHHNFYLGPVAAVRAGRSMLVDVNCQYGVGVIYFIAFVFDRGYAHVPPSVVGFAVIITALAIVQYTVIYATLRSITRSVPLSALVLALMILVPRFEQIGYPTSYPSTGALRFLAGYLLLGCFALRGRFPSQRFAIYGLEALVVGASSIWSFESFVYVFAAYLASLVYETAHSRRGELLSDLEARLTPTFLAVTMFHASLLFITRSRSGEWPHWSRYLDYIRLYSTQEFGALPVEPWTPWLPIVGVYMLTVIALAYRRITLGRADFKPEHGVVFSMSSLGIAQFTYFVGRSHLNNLFHIAVPAFFVAGYWFITAAKKTPHASDAFRRSLVFVCYGLATFLALSAVPDVMKKFDHTLLSYVMNDRDWPKPVPSFRATDAEQLIRHYAPTSRRVAFFTSSDAEIETFLLTKRTSVWPRSNPIQDELIEEAKTRIFGARTGLKVGDVIFVDTGYTIAPAPDQVHLIGSVHAMDRELFSGIVNRFGFEVLEARSSGIVALRLTAR